MPGWDVSPSGVGAVVSRVGDVMDILDDIVQAYGKDMEGAATSAGTLAPGGANGAHQGQGGLVAAALAEFMTGRADELQFTGVRVVKPGGWPVPSPGGWPTCSEARSGRPGPPPPRSYR
jgi:hypothetical protein